MIHALERPAEATKHSNKIFIIFYTKCLFQAIIGLYSLFWDFI